MGSCETDNLRSRFQSRRDHTPRRPLLSRVAPATQLFRKFSGLEEKEKQLGVELVHEPAIQAAGAIFGRENPPAAEP